MKLSRRTAHFPRPLGTSIACVLLGAVLGCSERVSDETRLSELTPDERQELCDEMAATLPSADEGFTCSDGSTVRFGEPDAMQCGAAAQDTCAASAGDVRACLEALVADPCAAFTSLPTACAPLQAAGCNASYATPSLNEQCPAAAASDIAQLEGIYELVRHTRHESSCDIEGASVLGEHSQQLFVLVGAELFGAPDGVLRSCRDLADCRDVVSGIRAASQDRAVRFTGAQPSPELSENFLCKAPEVGSLLGGGYSVGNGVEGRCALSQTPTTLARAADGSLRAERRTFAWTTPSQNDSCGYDGSQPPPGVACSALEVYQGRFLMAL